MIAAILVPFFQRFRISPTLGFLIIGTAIGPFGLGLFVQQIPLLQYMTITELEGVRAFAEFGIIFLLFTVGLELTIGRLWSMRQMVFGLGFAQFIICSAFFSAIIYALGLDVKAAILIGACIALSSTAIVIQLLVEKGRFSSRVGRTGFSILLFQDLAVVPVILLVGILGAESQGGLGLSVLTALGTAVAVIAAIIFFGQLVLRPLFRLVTFKNSPEFFMALTLLILIIASAATGTAGLSMALGAFLAGLLLAETEFRHQIEIDIVPFKGLLMGLFFMSIGMGIDLRVVWQDLNWLLLAVTGIFALKAALITGLCFLFALPRHVAIPTGLILGQVGEFAFVIMAMVLHVGIVSPEVSQFIIVVASLSMIATPFIFHFSMHLADELSPEMRSDHPYKLSDDEEELKDHVIIAGYGRVGQTIAKMLTAQQTKFVAVDRNGPEVMKMKHSGHPVIFGNSNRKEVLKALGADKASACVVTLNDPKATLQTVKVCSEEWPELPIIVRAYDPKHEEELIRYGASQVVGEVSEFSLQLAGFVMHEVGAPLEALNALKDEMRQIENETLVEKDRKTNNKQSAA